MAASPPKLFVATIWLCAALAALAAESAADRQQPIDLKTESYEVDFRSGKTLMHKVAISQGDVSITAERAEATGLDFDDSRWVFSGDVEINVKNDLTWAQGQNLFNERLKTNFGITEPVMAYTDIKWR